MEILQHDPSYQEPELHTPQPLSIVREVTGLPVVLRIQYRLPGTQTLAVLGSLQALGNMDPRNPLPAYLVSRDLWEIRVTLPPLTAVNFKFLVLERASRAIIRWERGGNRRLLLTDRGVIVHTEWEGVESISEIDPVPVNTMKECTCKDMFASLDGRVSQLESSARDIEQWQNKMEKKADEKMYAIREEIQQILTRTCKCPLHRLVDCPECPLQTQLRARYENAPAAIQGTSKQKESIPGPEETDENGEADGPTFWEQLIEVRSGACGEMYREADLCLNDKYLSVESEGVSLFDRWLGIFGHIGIPIGLALVVVAACFICRKCKH